MTGRACLLVALTGCRQILGLNDLPDGGGAGDASSTTVTIVDDDATQLGAGTLAGGAIDPAGRLEPRGYVRGGLHATAYQVPLFGNSATSWSDVAQAIATAMPTGEGYGMLPVSWSTDRPHGLGLTNSDNFSVLYDGEVFLAAGTHDFVVGHDDFAVVELDPGTGFTAAAAGISVSADGWYPIRAAIVDTGGAAHLSIAIDQVPLAANVTRARVDRAAGLLATVVPSPYSTAMPALGILVPTVDRDYGTAIAPFDVDVIHGVTYFLRLAGQVRIDASGDYAIAPSVTGSDLVSVWLDRHLVAGTGPIHLDAGWHGLLVDMFCNQATSHDAQLGLTIGGQPIPPSALRPVATSGQLVTIGGPITALADAPATTVIPYPSAATTPGTVVDGVLIGVNITGTASDYTAVFDFGGGIVVPLPPLDAVGLLNFQDDHARGMRVPTAPGTWKLLVTDHVAGGASAPQALSAASVTAHGGAAMPLEPSWSYTSTQHPTPGATALGAIVVDEALDGAMQLLEVRTSASDAAWVPVASGKVPATPAGDFVQYRITINGDGWQFPTVDRVAISYVVPSS